MKEPIFLSDKIKEAYNQGPAHYRLTRVKQVLLDNTPKTLKWVEAKRITNAYNLAVDELTKEHGKCSLKKVTINELFKP